MPNYKRGEHLAWRYGNTWVSVRFVRMVALPVLKPTERQFSDWRGVSGIEDARAAAIVSVSDGSEFTAMLEDLRRPVPH